MSSFSCDFLTSCHCIYHFRSGCKHSDVFLSISGFVGNAVLCFCLVQLRNTLLCMCQRFKNESSDNPNKPKSVDAVKLTFISLYGEHCRTSSSWLPSWFAAHHFSMSHFWPREKNWPTETRKKALLVLFTNREFGNGLFDTAGDQCQIKCALLLHMMSCGHINCQCNESENRQWLLLYVFFWVISRSLNYTYIYTYIYTGCPRRNGRNFGRVFLMLNYTDITQNTYIQSWTVTEIMAREVWNFDSCYTLFDYQIHIKTSRNMWFL